MSSIRSISPDELVPGMQLAEDCFDAKGNLLQPSGTLIDQQTMARLQQGKPVTIQVYDVGSVDEIGRQQTAELQRIQHLFRHAGDSIYAQALLNAVVAYRQQQRGDTTS